MTIDNKPTQQEKSQHQLAMVCYQKRKYQEAIAHYQRAIEASPNTSLLHLQLGNVYKTISQYELARSSYNNAIEISSKLNSNQEENQNLALALHNLGVLAYLEGNIKLAINYYQLAIKHKADYVDAHYHLAICFLKTGEQKKSIELLTQTIALCPRHFSALFMLGIEYMRKENYITAIEHFKKAQLIQMDHIELQINLGHCFFHTKQYLYARDCYRYALELKPGDKDLHFNLGVLAEKENFDDHAINHYLNTIKIDPNYYPAHYNISLLFLTKQHPSKAKKHLEIASTLEPNNQNIKFMLAAVSKDPRLKAAPSNHIENLFDQYADRYDEHMCQALDYQLPEQLFNFYQTLHLNDPNQTQQLNILDLGCGTGLAVEKFIAYAKQITGVDLSKNMLEIAKQKNYYSHLAQDNILDFLRKNNLTFDLIIAADTLVYFGELDLIFKHITQSLAPNGIFLMNLEEGSTPPYIIDQSGRFLHHPSYINTLIDQYCLKLIRATTVVTRQQNNQPVNSLVYGIGKN